MTTNILLRFLVILIILHNLCEIYVDCKTIETVAESHEQRLNNGTKECSQMGLHCGSCADVVMCIQTDFGWNEQHVQTCDPTETCLNGKCTSEENIFCDGYTKVPFQCHVPGAFPDPFDCKSYHLCVLDKDPINLKPILKDFKHTCGPNYRYDSKSTYCKYRIAENSCSFLPVPVCMYPGHSEALKENDSIFFICEEIKNIIYPHLYACPHGEKYVTLWKTCSEFEPTYPPATDSTVATEYPTDYTTWYAQ